VLDRLRDLRCDRNEQIDLVLRELARLERPHVERSRKALAREDRNGEDRFVFVLTQVRKLLEARVEVGLRRNHDGRAFRRGHPGDPLAWMHARPSRHLLDARPVRRAQDQLVAAIVVEVHETGLRAEGVRDLARDETQHLLEVQRRVHRRNCLGKQAEMALTNVHCTP
jgi:hypothetical protein